MTERNIESPFVKINTLAVKLKIQNFGRTVSAFKQSISCKTYTANKSARAIGSGDPVGYVFAA
jgi:hypothetical protein